jgi:hypothetical protein
MKITFYQRQTCASHIQSPKPKYQLAVLHRCAMAFMRKHQKCPQRRQIGYCLLDYDNAPVHTAQSVQQFIAKMNGCMSPLSYSVDVIPCSLFLLTKMELKLAQSKEISWRSWRISKIFSKYLTVLQKKSFRLTSSTYYDNFQQQHNHWAQCY